jgi:LPXTG-site transpeptidase (sortase) family protein
MKRLATWMAVLSVASLLTLAASQAFVARAQPRAFPPPGLGQAVRYIGRDTATGMPVTVSDRFIAAVEESIARYGKDAGEAVPAPPAKGTDIARLSIPALGVDAPVGRFGVDRYGRLDVPQDSRTVGWNPAYASLPGTGGATFLAAHFEYAGAPGVFSRLSALREGDTIAIDLTGGKRLTYRVTSTVDYALGSIDMGALLAGREGRESLTLMTCSGPANEGEYPLRTVVLAEAVP